MNETISTLQRSIPRARSRILPQDQPDELREPFARLYPNGLPKEYKMYHAHRNEVSMKYIEDNLPLGFYTNPPSDAKGIFSTNGGRTFRQMHHILPRRKLHLWSKNEIQENCNSIRKAHWEAMRGMTEPLCWDDLWKYFDAFDLYHYGAINLWNIINHLYAENRIITADVMKSAALEFGRWTDLWLQVPANAEKLKSCDTAKGSVMRILEERDWESLGRLSDTDIPMLANALRCRRDHLLSPAAIESAEARSLVASSRDEGGVENWMTGQTIHSNTGLPQYKQGEAFKQKNFKPPCVVIDGKHYYEPQLRERGAVEALKASVEAASSHVVVANGSKMSPPRYPLADRIAAAKKYSETSQPALAIPHTRPNSSDGSSAMTSRSSGTTQSVSPRRMSDSTIRPSHLSSPQITHGSSVSPGSAAIVGVPTALQQSRTPPLASGGHEQPAVLHGTASNASCSPQRHTDTRSTYVSHNERAAPDTNFVNFPGPKSKIGSPYRGKGVDSHGSQHSSSPSSRTQFGRFNAGSKPFAKKWNHGFRHQENFVPMADGVQRDFSNPGTSRADTQVNGGGQACPNAPAGLDRFDYIPCGCYNCVVRNRSVWVRVFDGYSLPLMEVQTRVRYGIESRFGLVEEVNHAVKTNTLSSAIHFIVRFVSEDSVGQALAHGGGRIEEKGIKANICAMFRSKWVLLPSVWHAHPTGPQDSIYKVYKAPPQRRGDMPFGQDVFMARGPPPAQRTPSGPFMNNSRHFGQTEPRHFGQGGPFQGKKSRLSLNAEGSSEQQPFHAFRPHAQFHGPPIETANTQTAAILPKSLLQEPKIEHAQPEMPFQSQPSAEEALGKVDGAAQRATMPQVSAIGNENTKPRVSLPERPEATSNAAPEQCQPQDVPEAPLMLLSKSPVKQSKKKRQAAQLRASNQEGNGPATTASGPLILSVTATAATAAAAATVTGQSHAKEEEVRRPSLFTAEEIRDRKQAWDRIAVPLSSPRKHSLTAEDAPVSARPGHDRTKSLPASALPPPTKADAAAEVRHTINNAKEAPAPKSAERDGKPGSDADQPAGGEERVSSAQSASSPKKSSKAARKKKNRQDKLPAKKEHKM